MALNAHRQHHLEGANKDWDAFFESCDKDEPNWPVIGILNTLYRAGHLIEIWSGRSDKVRDKTEYWQTTFCIKSSALIMRPVSDFQSDVDLKQSWLDAAPIKPDLVFDDRNSVVKMWRDNGITCCQVADGDF